MSKSYLVSLHQMLLYQIRISACYLLFSNLIFKEDVVKNEIKNRLATKVTFLSHLPISYLGMYVTRNLSINPLRCSGKIKLYCDNIVVLWFCGLPTPSPKSSLLLGSVQYFYRNSNRDFWSIETSQQFFTLPYPWTPIEYIEKVSWFQGS